MLGGNPDYDAPGNFYPTTIVTDIDPLNPLVPEEQFGVDGLNGVAEPHFIRGEVCTIG